MKTSNNKLIIIGIDSLEPVFVYKLINSGKSRGFIHFYENGIFMKMRSTYPPDTLLAWPSIYTGLLHQRFGLRPEPESMIELQKMSLKLRKKLIGKTFWDIASRYKIKVCVVNPIFGYPPWCVNGIMVSGPSFGLKGSPLSVPPRNDIKKFKLGTFGKTPILLKEYKEMYNEAVSQLLDVFSLTERLINEYNCELVFVADYTLDRIQHYFWRFYDKDDSARPRIINPYGKYIETYYELIDRIIARFIKKYGNDYNIVVLGDHGHSRRPTKLISIEKILNGMLDMISLSRALRDVVRLSLYYSNMDVYVYKIIWYLQSKGKLGRLVLKINEKQERKDNENIKIKTLREFGLKEYVGLKINYTLRKDKIIEVVRKYLSRTNIVDFIISPNEFYENDALEYESDLYIKLKEFGNYPEIDSFLVLPNYTKHIISGGHSLYTLFMISTNKVRPRTNILRVHDVAPTVLSLLGLSYANNTFDGHSIL